MLKRKVVYGGKISEITYRNDGRAAISQLRKAIDSIYYINASYFGTQRRSYSGFYSKAFTILPLFIHHLKK